MGFLNKEHRKGVKQDSYLQVPASSFSKEDMINLQVSFYNL